MRKFLLAAAVAACLASPAFGADVEGFHKTWAKAQKAALADNKPIFLHFTTTWCGWCRKIEKDIYANAEGKKALEAFVPASLDCTVPRGQKPSDEAKLNIDMMKKWGGGGYPFLAMVTADGVVLNTFSGYKLMAPFKAELTKALDTHKEWTAFQAEAKKADINSYDFNVKAMTIYVKVRRFDLAASAARKVRKLDPKNEKGHAAEAAKVLLAAAEEKGDAKQAGAALADIKKFDPKNEKGILEKAVHGHALKAYQATRRLPAAEKNKRLEGAIAALTDLTASGAKLNDAQNDYHLLGFLYMVLGQKDKARSALEKALAADPKSPAAERIKGRIESLKGGK